jgi:hypothetical protein
MGRPRNRFELRAEAEAIERLGMNTKPERKPRAEPTDRRPRPSESAPRMRMVWAVCDVGGRTVKSFEYSDKTGAEAFANELKSKGKGVHYVRAIKEPMLG